MTRLISHRITILALAALAVATVGCRKKKEPETGAKSVDAILSGDETQRQNLRCGKAGADSETPDGAVAQVYAQLPNRFKAFPELQSHIKLADAEVLKTTCKEIFEKQAAKLFSEDADVSRALKRLDNLGACWSLSLAGKLPEVPVPTIHVARDVTAIHNNLIAMVTYGLIELYADRVGDGFEAMPEEQRQRLAGQVEENGKPVSATDVMSFVNSVRDLRRRLAAAVIADLTRLGRTDTLASYQETFKDKRLLENFFFAETVESYYCSSESRELFTKRDMTSTLAVAKEIARYLDK